MKDVKEKEVIKTATEIRKQFQSNFRQWHMTKEDASKIIYGTTKNATWMFSDN